jgi:hypothetical protein
MIVCPEQRVLADYLWSLSNACCDDLSLDNGTWKLRLLMALVSALFCRRSLCFPCMRRSRHLLQLGHAWHVLRLTASLSLPTTTLTYTFIQNCARARASCESFHPFQDLSFLTLLYSAFWFFFHLFRSLFRVSGVPLSTLPHLTLPHSLFSRSSIPCALCEVL